MLLIARDRHGYVNDPILEEFNIKYVIYFLKPIIDKEFIFYSDELNSTIPFSIEEKLVIID